MFVETEFEEYQNGNNRNRNTVRNQGKYNSILDFNFNDVELLKELKVRSLEHVERVYGANRESGDKILLYFHFPYVEKSVTLHLHTRINSPQHNLELARSFMLEDIIEGLENEITIYEIIQQRIKTDCGYLLYEKFKQDRIVKKFLSQYQKDIPSFNTQDELDKYYANAKYEIIDNPFRISNFTPKKFSKIPYSEPKTYNDYLTLTVSKCVLPEFKVKEEFSISKNSDIIVEGFPRKKTKKKNKFPKKKKTQNLKIKKKIIKRKKNAK